MTEHFIKALVLQTLLDNKVYHVAAVWRICRFMGIDFEKSVLPVYAEYGVRLSKDKRRFTINQSKQQLDDVQKQFSQLPLVAQDAVLVLFREIYFDTEHPAHARLLRVVRRSLKLYT